MRQWCGMLGLLVLMPALTAAAESPLEAARRCGTVHDSLERLVCYDRLFAPEVQPAAKSAAVPAPAANPTPPRMPSAPVVAATVPPPPAAAPVAATPALGDESLRGKRQQKATTPTDLTANVTALKEVQKDLYRISLDNGQVWQQVESSSLFQVAVGDGIRIEKGMMGGYRMTRTSGVRSGWVRVNRVE